MAEKVRILFVGVGGKMGRVATECIRLRDDCEMVAGVDISDFDAEFPIYKKAVDVKEKYDVIIDFSHPSALDDILTAAESTNSAVVIATTGYDDTQIAKINDAAKKMPVFFTYNMSLGVNLIADLARRAAAVLSDGFDIEIVEAHHNQKIDAPSGTAMMLYDAISDSLDDGYYCEYDRHSHRRKREKKEIGMHAIRGGTIVGEHEIIFAGRDEIVKLSHSARSKEIFAVGAVNAAVFMSGREAGLYNMSDLVSSK